MGLVLKPRFTAKKVLYAFVHALSYDIVDTASGHHAILSVAASGGPVLAVGGAKSTF